ncbi:hypothetical protein [Lacunimicrobium album]
MEQAILYWELAHRGCEIADVVAHIGPRDENSLAVAPLADLLERVRLALRRAGEVLEQIHETNRLSICEYAIAKFDPLRDTLTPREQVRVLELLT